MPIKRISIIISALIIALAMLILGITKEPEMGESVVSLMTVEGKEISLNYTDENDNEDLIIKSDKQEYRTLGNVYVFFSVENTSKENQNIQLSFPFVQKEKTRTVLSLEEKTGDRVIDVEEKIIPNKTVVFPTTTIFTPTSTIPAYSKTVTDWQTISKDKGEKSVSLIEKTKEGNVASEVYTIFLSAGEIGYFRAVISNPDPRARNEEFFIEAVGDRGGYGLLDPGITVIEDFNSYTDGDLNGQGGWSGITSMDIQGTTVVEGAKAVRGGSGTYGNLYKDISAITLDTVSFYVRSDSPGTHTSQYTWLMEGASNYVANINFYYEQGVYFGVKGANNDLLLATYVQGTWYKFDIQIDAANDRARGRIDGGDWTTWRTADAYAEINRIMLYHEGNSDHVDLWDYFTVGEETATPKPNSDSPLIFD